MSKSEGTEAIFRGQRLIMCGSNNYLGLTTDPRVRRAAIEAVSVVNRLGPREIGRAVTHDGFRPSAAGLFPEMRDRIVRRHPNGKPTIEVPTRSLPGIKTAFRARADFLVFLNRSSSVPSGLISIPKAEALERLLAELPLFDPAIREQQEAPCRDLVAAATFELRYQDLGSAVSKLESLVRGRK